MTGITRLLTANETADALHIHRNTLATHSKPDGNLSKIKTTMIGKQKFWLENSVNEFIEGGK
jgi:hypothetical protein